MSDELQALHRLELIDRALSRKTFSQKTGKMSSALDERLDEVARASRPRTDHVGVEGTERMLLFLRQLFSQNKELTWLAGKNGISDPSGDILIESDLSQKQIPFDLRKPIIRIRPGPTQSQAITAIPNGLKHIDFYTGIETYTTLEPGTLVISCYDTQPALALQLASFVKMALRAHYKHLCHRSFHDITNIAVGGYDRENPGYNRSSETVTHAVVPVTLTYTWQVTYRIQPRRGVYELARTAVTQTSREVETGGPYIDSRRDGVIESETITSITPLNPDAED